MNYPPPFQWVGGPSKPVRSKGGSSVRSPPSQVPESQGLGDGIDRAHWTPRGIGGGCEKPAPGLGSKGGEGGADPPLRPLPS